MSLLGKLFDALNESSSTHAHGNSGDSHVLIRCAACGSGDLFRENMETIVCNSCGKRYSMDEARKAMGTANCRDCIYIVSIYMTVGLQSIALYGDWMSAVPDVIGRPQSRRIDGQMQTDGIGTNYQKVLPR